MAAMMKAREDRKQLEKVATGQGNKGKKKGDHKKGKKTGEGQSGKGKGKKHGKKGWGNEEQSYYGSPRRLNDYHNDDYYEGRKRRRN